MRFNSGKLLASAAVAAALALSVGCAAQQPTASTDTLTPGPGEPALMPANHQGRFERLGAPGCYGCHGAGEDAASMLADATPLPDDHYVNGDHATREVFGARGECITCHPQG